MGKMTAKALWLLMGAAVLIYAALEIDRQRHPQLLIDETDEAGA